MKVYATTESERGGRVELTIFPSVKDFESKENWCDEKWIDVVIAKNLENFEFCNEWSCVCYSEIEQKSQMLLMGIFLGRRGD